MQPFRLRTDAREWFRTLREQGGGFKVDFDAFYFCFIAGIATQQKEIPQHETAELVNYFPDRYGSRGKLLVGLFLKTELELLGVSMDERQVVNSTIAQFVTPEAPNFLSDEGVKEFNKYAHGGYEQLLEWFEDRPRNIETFLRGFKEKLDENMIKKEI